MGFDDAGGGVLVLGFDDAMPSLVTIQKQQIKILKENAISQDADIRDYHDTFTELFRASEKVRTQQKYQYQEQAIIAQQDFDRRVKEIEESQKAYVQKTADIVEFEPEPIQANDFMNEYIAKSVELGVPLIDILPPTMIAQSLTWLGESSSSSDYSSIGYTTCSSGKNSSTTSSTTS